MVTSPAEGVASGRGTADVNVMNRENALDAWDIRKYPQLTIRVSCSLRSTVLTPDHEEQQRDVITRTFRRPYNGV